MSMKIKSLVLGALQTNCYIVGDDDCCQCAVIDPAADASSIIAAASEMGCEIKKILLTHSHFDHFEALNELYNKTGAQVLVSADDKPGLSYPQLNLSSSFGFGTLIFQGEVTAFHDGDSITVGNVILEVMSTPGHTPGSVCFILHDSKTIFSGDTVFAESIGRTDFPGGSFEAIIHSLNAVLAMDKDYKIMPGHGPVTTVEKESKYNPYYRC